MKKNFPLYTQLDSMDCGPTCLRMIAQYYGRKYSLQYLREQSFITRLGVSMLGISDAAEHIGFRSISARCDVNQLIDEAPLPCILHWNQQHFVVCYGIEKESSWFRNKKEANYKFKIADPGGEKFTLTEKEFLKCWISTKHKSKDMGTALLLDPTPEFYTFSEENSDQQEVRTLATFWHYLLPYKSQLLQLGAGLIISSIVSLITPFLTQSVIDQGIGYNNLSFVTLVLIAQLVITVTMTFVGFVQSWISLYMNTKLNITLISDFLRKLMKLPIRFFDTKNVGDILQRIGDHDRIEAFLIGTPFSIVFSIVNFIIFAIIMAYYNSTILTIFLVGNLFNVGWVLLFMRYRRKLDYSRFTQAAAEQGNLYSLIAGMQDIKLNNCEKQQRWKWERIQIKLFKIGVKGVTLDQIQHVGSLFFTQATSILLSYLSAKYVIEGEITLGVMVAISYILGQLSGPIGQIIGIAHSFQDAKISLERLNEIHNKEDEELSISGKMTLLPDNKSLTLKDVSFSYSGAERDFVLNDVSISIPENKITAIVGESGSGKTTIVKLLLGFYLPQKGSISVADIPIGEINPHVWRHKVGAVLQESYIFSDTIARNIAPDVDEIDKERLLYAAMVANIHEFIDSLPLKYNTKIGMEGNGISQGQRQRLLIARAVYKNPDFILLDEATNSLDTVNEKKIIDNLNTFYQGKTVVIVAHRLSTVKNADNIIVMSKGKMIEEGTHSELIEKRGAYYTLVSNQLELGA